MVKKRIESFGHAFKGLAILVRTQPNAKFHLFATIFVIILGLFLNISYTDWAILALAVGSVWAAEALNTGLEFLADRVAPEWHELVGNAKDVAAGGVLAVSITAAVAGLLIFLPYIF
ncbi:MAG: diacylglycerol kinase family protein [Candidatus Sabulitectum sp.]|nr:diacylglycerol kinase family protein [Candidatus Sabulitectum sp.]